ncbi:hypothetical protein G9F72_000685 [Clostridium estertheticum]|nr:hypothetical protein [Clostridium estertheticum]MBZ9684891.1 hypothetical protein [Clostridium estertheticum]
MEQLHHSIYGNIHWIIKLPLIEKIHEAYSAIADNRVVLREGSASVFS